MPEIPNPAIFLLAAIFAFAVLLLAVFRLQRRRRRAGDLSDSPLPDYNRVLAELRRRQAAEPRPPVAAARDEAPSGAPRRDDVGERRQQRQRRIELRALGEGERRAYFAAWQRLQTQAGADPRRVVEQGLKLCEEVLQARGFLGEPAAAGAPARRVPSAPLTPVEAAALSADYDRLRDLAGRSARGTATAEEQRQALVVLQALLHHLLATGVAPVEPRRYAAG